MDQLLLPLAVLCGVTALNSDSVRAQPVDANVVTAVDVSGSINGIAERLEFEGLAEAIEHPAFLHAISGGPTGSIGFAAFTWSSQGDFVQLVPWQRIRTAEQAGTIAAMLRDQRRGALSQHHSLQRKRPWRTSLGTDVSAAIEMATALLDDSPFSSDRQLLNICANGIDNIGEPPDLARDAAIERGITVNAMILGDKPDVADYFRMHVQGGPGAFVMSVFELGDLVDGVLAKFMLELADDRTIPARDRRGQVVELAGML